MESEGEGWRDEGKEGVIKRRREGERNRREDGGNENEGGERVKEKAGESI